MKRRVWEFLNAIDSTEMLDEGRVYGGGLHKLEPRELGRVRATVLSDLLPESKRWDEPRQLGLLPTVPS